MKKMTLLSMALVLTVSPPVFSDDDISEQRRKFEREYFAKQGMPVPGSGVQVIPEKNMSSWSEIKEKREKYRKDIQKFGYINEDSPSTTQLLHMKIVAEKDYKKHGGDFKKTSTHIKKNINELQMAYTFIGAPSEIIDEHIGYAPYLTFLDGKGWVGAVHFFTNSNAGSCLYSENNILLSNGAAIIAKEDVTEDINGKVTTKGIMGRPESGFTYTVEWFDKSFFRKLECANKEYNPAITEKMIEMAKTIDSQV